MANSRFEAPSWDQVYAMLMTLSSQVKKSGFKPDVIVGVSRGGWPPARIMSDLLQNDNLANMKVVFYKDIGVRNRAPVITQPLSSSVRGKRVLVVDDVSDSGHSLCVVSNHLKKKRAKDTRVCTLYLKPKSVFIPDYYSKMTSKWVIFPWERLEAVNLIASRKSRKASRDSMVFRTLKGSGLQPQLIRRLLRMSFNGEN